MSRSRPVDNDPVTAYARAVVAGRILAGRPVHLACARHLRDLVEGPKRGLRWNLRKARRAIEFFPEFLRLAEGEHAGKPFQLEPWQAFIVGSLFGWEAPDGYRRFRTAYIEVGKGNGKTPMAAGLELYGLVADDEEGAEIYSAAVTREQAGISFLDAKKMAEASTLAAKLDIGKNNIAFLATRSFLRPVSSEGRGLDGKRVHVAVIDEIHEHRDAVVVDKMRAGTKGRRQALIVEITNSGYDRQSVCWEHHELSLRVLEGVIEKDEWFAYVCQLDPCEACRAKGKEAPQDGCEACDQFTDERGWIKANPNLDVSVTRKYLRELVHDALAMPSKRNIVLRLNFCRWTESATRWFTPEQWAACAAPLSGQLLGRPCVAGIDLATTTDLAALMLLFPDDDFFVERVEEGEEAPAAEGPILSVQGGVDVVAFFWCPEDSIRQRSQADRVPYELWRDQGHVEATPGNVIDYRRIRRRINALREEGYAIAEVCYDPAFATQFALQLQDEDGFTAVSVSQGFDSLNEPAHLLELLVQSGRLRHAGHPVLGWCAANVVVDVDGGGRKRPSKRRSTERIDGISALVTGLKRIIAARGMGSVYDTRGLLTV